MYRAKNCYVKIDNTEMEYVTFGNGTQPFIIIPGLGDALKTVRGTAVPFSYIVGGERDYIVGNKAAYEIAENISDCKLKIYEKYGHGAFEEAKDFNDLVLKFLV